MKVQQAKILRSLARFQTKPFTLNDLATEWNTANEDFLVLFRQLIAEGYIISNDNNIGVASFSLSDVGFNFIFPPNL